MKERNAMTRHLITSCLALVIAGSTASAFVIDATYRGFVTSSGQTSDGMLGEGNSYMVGFSFSTVTRRNYLYFALPTLAPGESISSARLTLAGGTLNLEGFTTRSVNLWDVSTSIGQIGWAYDDIGSGNSYGSFQVDRSDPIYGITSYSVDLNTQAILDLNSAAGGLFAIGGTLDVSNNGVSRYQVFANTGGSSVNDGNTRLSVNIVPEPSTLALALSAVIAIAIHRRLNLRRWLSRKLGLRG